MCYHYPHVKINKQTIQIALASMEFFSFCLPVVAPDGYGSGMIQSRVLHILAGTRSQQSYMHKVRKEDLKILIVDSSKRNCLIENSVCIYKREIRLSSRGALERPYIILFFLRRRLLNTTQIPLLHKGTSIYFSSQRVSQLAIEQEYHRQRPMKIIYASM